MTILGKEITKKLIYKILGYSVVVLVVGGVLVYFGLVWREKQQFAQAEKEIDSLYAQIVEKIGKPDQEKKEKSCGYASRVYGRGPRSCSVSVSILYADKDISKANEVTNYVSQSLNIKPSRYYQNGYYGQGEYKYEFAVEDERKINQHLSTTVLPKISMGCSIDFVHPVVGSTYREIFDIKSDNNLVISLVCGGPALTEHFPVKD